MTTMTPGQVIRNAIEAEMAASRFYGLLSESTHDPRARAFLDQMSAAEIAHAQSIERRGQSLVEGKLPSNAQGDVEVIETLPEWKYVDEISWQDALNVAKAAEIQAALYYDAIADSLSPELGEFFRELAREEERHAQMIDEQRVPVVG